MPLFKIGAFSKLSRVSVRMLRYYDAMGLLKPAEIDPQSGYRLYAADQIPKVNRIVFLRDLGFGVTEIAQALEDWSEKSLEILLRSREESLQREREALDGQLTRIRRSLEALGSGKQPPPPEVRIKSVPSYPVFSLRRVIPDYYAEGALWKEMAAFAKAHPIPLLEDTLSIYHDPEYREQDVDVELCAKVNGSFPDLDLALPEGFAFRHTRGVEHMAYTTVNGPFENIAPAYLAFVGWLAQQPQYALLDGSSRQIVHRGPWNEAHPENYLTEIQIPLEIHLDSHTV